MTLQELQDMLTVMIMTHPERATEEVKVMGYEFQMGQTIEKIEHLYFDGIRPLYFTAEDLQDMEENGKNTEHYKGIILFNIGG